MEKIEDIQELAKVYLEKAEEKLRNAKVLLKEKFVDDAISRAYYSAFLSAKALLLLLGSDVKTHSGLITMFNLKVVRGGLLPREIGRYLSELFEARQTSDYSPISLFDIEDAKEYIKKAELLLSAVKEIIYKRIGV